MTLRAIYEPKGRAREYAHLALNPWGYSWCSHDCIYCYVPRMCRKTHEQWRKTPFKPVKDIVQKVRHDCRELQGTNKRVHLCFAGDLYSPEAIATGIGRQILEAFVEFDVPFQVLTKGGMRACADFDLYRPGVDAFAVTLTYRSGMMKQEYEPRAADVCDRILSLGAAKSRGIETWVSFEPVIVPEVTLRLMRLAHSFTDLYKIGTLNHAKTTIDWREFGWRAIDLCENLGKRYWIKADLAKHLRDMPFTNTDNRTTDWEGHNRQ